MEPSESGIHNPLAHLQSEGESVPWTPREIRSADAPAGGLEAVPFVVQVGSSMLMIGLMPTGWVLAELRFDSKRCTFREVRKATYTWPREAFGVLLSRLPITDTPPDTVDRLTREFADWVGSSFSRLS